MTFVRAIFALSTMAGLYWLVHWLVYEHSSDFDNGLIVGFLLLLLPLFAAYKLNGNRL